MRTRDEECGFTNTATSKDQNQAAYRLQREIVIMAVNQAVRSCCPALTQPNPANRKQVINLLENVLNYII